MNSLIKKQAIIKIGKGFRFQWEDAQQAYVLLYPEGMIQLNFSAGEILNLCDGTRSVEDVIISLQNMFPGTDLEKDVYEFLEDAYAKSWITFN